MPKHSGPGRDFERERLLDTSPSASDDELADGEHHGRQNNRFKEVRLQVEEVASTMKQNIQKVLERGTRLDDLNERSENLQSASDSFHTAARRLQRTMWWKEMRIRLILGSLCAIVVIILITWLSVKYQTN